VIGQNLTGSSPFKGEDPVSKLNLSLRRCRRRWGCPRC